MTAMLVWYTGPTSRRLVVDQLPSGALAAGGDEVADEAAVPVFPVLAADLVHGVGGVVMAVVEVHAG